MFRSVFICFVLSLFNSINAQELIPYLDSPLYGFADPAGTLSIPPQYDMVTFFDQGGIAYVRKGNHWSVINTSGKVLLPFTAKEQPILDFVYSSDTITAYRKTNGTDTILHLRMLPESYHSFRILNTRTTSLSPIYTRFTRISNPSFGGPATATFERGIFLGKISDTLYHILNTDAEVMHVTHSLPRLWNDSIVSSEESNQIILFDVQTHEIFKLPYFDLFTVVNKDLFVVTDWRVIPDEATGKRKNYFRRGLVDRHNNIIMDLQYVSIWGGFSNTPLIVSTEKASYLVDVRGQRIDTNTYKGILPLSDDCYMAQLANGKQVLLKRSGLHAMPDQYDTLYMVSSDYYGYKQGNIAGLISMDFKPVVQFPADKIQKTQVAGLFTIVKNGKYGLINAEGIELAPAVYDACWPIPTIPYIDIRKDGKEGLLRYDGSMVFEPIYEDVSYRRQHDVFLFFTKLNGLYTYYDESLKVVKDSMPDNRYGSRDIYSERANGLHYILDRYGKRIGGPVEKFALFWVASDSSTFALIFKDDLYFIMKPDGSFLTNDSVRLEKNPAKFRLEEGLFGVKTGSLQGVINHRSEWIIPPDEQEIIGITASVIVVKKSDGFYLHQLDGSRIDHKPFTNLAFDAEQPWWAAEQDEKAGFIESATGKTVLPFIYDRTSNFYKNLAVVTIGKNKEHQKSILIDTTGRKVLETSFDQLIPLDSNADYRHYIASAGEKEGVVDIHGKVIIPIKYEEVMSFADTTLYVCTSRNNARQLLTRNGEVLCTDPDFPKSDEYLKLPGNRYLLLMKTHSLVIGPTGSILKSIDSPEVSLFHPGDALIPFLKVAKDGTHYFVNTKTLVEYRSLN